MDVEAFWRQLDDMGEAVVRRTLAEHRWAEERKRAAEQWLAHQESYRATTDSAAIVEAAREANRLASAANELAEAASALAREANSIARDASASAARSADAARTNNIIATLALIAAAIAIAISVIGVFMKASS